MTKNEIEQFAKMLVDAYGKQKAQYPHLDAIFIDLVGKYPSDKDMEDVVAYLDKDWVVNPTRFDASPDDSGCVWMSPKSGS